MGFLVAIFSTGLDSPFKELDEQKRSLLVKSRMSAGTISPAARRITSPTTTLLVSISWSLPSRIISVVTETILSKESTAFDDLTFWTKLVIPEISTIVTIMATVVKSFSPAGTKI